MLHVKYDPHSKENIFPDKETLNEAIKLIKENEELINSDGGKLKITTGSDLFCTALRVCVVRKLISHKNLVFLFEDYSITVDEKAEPSSFPSGFCDILWLYMEEMYLKSKK